jgi:hypothetical protein
LVVGSRESIEMKEQDLFTSGTDVLIPKGDVARQAVDSLRGYAYQVTAAALAWIDIEATSRIYLEVAEDYAVVAKGAIDAVQVKDTQASTKVTLNTESVRDAILNFINLVSLNDNASVQLRYFTTSEISTEKALQDRPSGVPGILYWRSAAKGSDVAPLREILDSEKFPELVREFVSSRGDEELRRDLLRKIHWDCGKPDLATLRKEFQDRLVVVGRDIFDIPAPDMMRISNLLVHHVLEKSIVESPAERTLTRADLISIIDNASRVSVPLGMVDMFAKTSSGLLDQLLGGSSAGSPVALGRPIWLVDGSDLPASKWAVPRPEVEERIEQRVRALGACFVSGASGVGKSSVSRSVAEKVGEPFYIVDFRNAGIEETQSRLEALISRLGGMRAQVIILEDLNQINDPSLASSTARVFEALSRRDIAVLVTSYNSPTPKTLAIAGHNPGSTTVCPYFSEKESASLVGLHGGDPQVWGKLAHVSGAFGHPQLVHAFIAGMTARGWPSSDIPAIIAAGLSTGDITAEREAARRSLISVLPEGARNMLYRLSMSIGVFSRAAALSIATAPPPIAQAGEALDILIGPWIETMGRDSYRVCPLAGQSGNDMLNAEQKQIIHGAIASELVSGSTVDASNVDKIILHAILGKNERVLASLTHKLLTSGSKLVSFLADNLVIFRVFKTDIPIYPENPYISVIMRLLQFRVLAAGQETADTASCVRALLSESERIEPSEARRMMQMLSLATVLGTLGIANHLENWIELLLQFLAIANGSVASNSYFPSPELDKLKGESLAGILFAIGSSNLTTVAKLEQVFEQLSRLEPADRAMLLKPIVGVTPGHSVLVNSPWVAEGNNALNALDAADRYQRMAVKASSWGFRTIAIQCSIAQTVMCDEYANDFEGALRVLDEASADYGDDVLISRARAKVYFRAQDHERALMILRGIADVVGKDNDIDRAFALREAAICAANCNDWAQAETWFLESQRSASQTMLPDMNAMSVGLGVDAAVAAFKIGQIARCLTGMADALTALREIKPESSLRCAHCHHLVRHTVLWMQSRMEGREVIIGDGPIVMRPGICSNPEPSEEIGARPLGSIDISWYMLAECEMMSRTNVGVLDRLYGGLSGDPIPIMEVSLRLKRMGVEIEDLSPKGFASQLLSFVEGMAYLLKHHQEGGRDFDVKNPARMTLPKLSPSDIVPNLSQFADEAVFAYAISCACKQSQEELLELRKSLGERFGEGVIGEAIFLRVGPNDKRQPPLSFEDVLIDTAMKFRPGIHATPREYCLAGVRFLQQAQRSHFRASLMRIIAAWQRVAWKRIVTSEKFRLSQPQRTIPAIQTTLAFTTDNERFICALILAAVDATELALPREVRESFEKSARPG